MNYKIAQLILTPGTNASTTCDIYIAQTDAIKEKLAGKLFLLIEIESPKTDSLKIINFLLNSINLNYYQNEKIILREKISTLKVEHIFEAALAKINTGLNEFIKSEKIRISLNSINATIGVIHEDSLYFANSGKNKVHLIYKQPKKEEENKETPEYKIIDIAGKTTAPDTIKPTDKLFSNVISGAIPAKGQFFITSEALPEYISNKQLIEIITTLPPTSAAEQIKNILSKINIYVSFLGLIIKSTSVSLPSEAAQAGSVTHDSILDLKETEDTTEELLSPSGIIDVKKWTRLISQKFSNRFAPTSDNSRQPTLFIKDKILFKKKSINLLSKIGGFFKNIFIHITNLVFFIGKNITKKDKLSAGFNNLTTTIKDRGEKSISSVLNLNFKSKILLTLAFGCIALFVINLSITRVQDKKTEEEESYRELTALIEQKQNQAEANLLYSNEEGAKKLFIEIETLLAEYPKDTEEQIAQLNAFNEKFSSQLEQIRKVERVDKFRELANFKNLNTNAKPDNIAFVKEANKIFAADAKEKSIYIFNLSDNLVTTLTDLKSSITDFKFPAAGPNNSIYYFNNTNIIQMNSENADLNDLSITLIGDKSGFAGLGTYNDRLYLLNAKDNQILRYNRSGNSFSGAYAWVSSTNVSFSGAVDMSIDGHIYVLKDNGEVMKLLRGELVDFKLETIDPPLETASKIFVSPEMKYIYILDPSQNRLIIYDKTGQFILQYLSDGFTNLVDFSVDENEKIIYLLNEASVFAFEGKHFEE